MQQDKYTVSNILTFLAAVFTAMTFLTDRIYLFWMNDYFLNQWLYHYFAIQIFTSQFIHGGALHLLMNSFFILYFWNALENIIWKNKMLLFFVLNSLFLAFFLTILWSANTVWISGFALSIITYYTLQLWSLKHPEYTGGIVAIVINVWIGLSPGISFLWHLWWVIFWWLFWFIQNKKK